MNQRVLVCIAALLVAILSVGCPQSDADGDQAREGSLQTGMVNVASDEALIIFTSGMVAVGKDGSWTQARAGARVKKEQSVKTAARSACELQFGKTAAVRIEENTEVAVAAIGLLAGGSRTGLRVAAGTLLCKVERLSGKERFEVRTRTAACGVRGTEFGVTVNGGGDTELFVRGGKVALTPAALDLDKLAEALPNGDPEAMAILSGLAEAERLVGPGQVLTVTNAQNEAAVAIVRTAETAIADSARLREPSATDKAAFKGVMERTKAALLKNAALPGPQDAVQRELLLRLDGLKRRQLDHLTGDEAVETTDVRYFTVGVATKPTDAEIYLGDEFLGVGKFEGLFSAGLDLLFQVRKAGYEPGRLALKVGPDTAVSHSIELPEPAVFTETFVNPSVAGSFEAVTLSGSAVTVSLGKQRIIVPAGGLGGLTYFPNSPPVLVSRIPFRLLVSVWDDTYLLEGTDLLNLQKTAPAITRGGAGTADNGRVSVSGLYTAPDGKMYAFYHQWDYEGFEAEPRIETEMFQMYYSRIGTAVSGDGGRSWRKEGPIVGSLKPKGWRSYDGQSTRGASDCSVTPDRSGRYLYLYFIEYARVAGRQVDLCLARADITQPLQSASSWKKYANGAFDQESLEGADTPVFSAQPVNDSDIMTPRVWYSKTLDQYVLIFNLAVWKEYPRNQLLDKGGVYIAFSPDGIAWSKPSRLIKDYPATLEGHGVTYAAGVVFDEGTDAAGWLVYAYSPNFGDPAKGLTPTHLAGRRISLKKK